MDVARSYNPRPARADDAQQCCCGARSPDRVVPRLRPTGRAGFLPSMCSAMAPKPRISIGQTAGLLRIRQPRDQSESSTWLLPGPRDVWTANALVTEAK